MNPKIISLKEASNMLNLSAETLRKMCVAGSIPSTRIGKKYFVPRQIVKNILAKAEQEEVTK